MSKPGLGKGLGQLMNGDKVAGAPPQPKPTLPAHTEFGRGLKTLLQEDANKEPAELPRELLPAWFFFAADILLLAMTVAIFFDAERPLTVGDVAFCGTTISLALILGLAGVGRAASPGNRD